VISRRKSPHLQDFALATQYSCSVTVKVGAPLGRAISHLCQMVMAGKAGSFLPGGDGDLGEFENISKGRRTVLRCWGVLLRA